MKHMGRVAAVGRPHAVCERESGVARKGRRAARERVGLCEPPHTGGLLIVSLLLMQLQLLLVVVQEELLALMLKVLHPPNAHHVLLLRQVLLMLVLRAGSTSRHMAVVVAFRPACALARASH